MKKIMFSDKFGLTQAVLDGRKTMTRRVIKPQPTFSTNGGICWKGGAYGLSLEYPYDLKGTYRNFITGTEYNKSCKRYRVGEVVAIAQSYNNAGVDPKIVLLMPIPDCKEMLNCRITFSGGWNNKLFVRADLMPKRIRIINVKIERLQDISDEECRKEGIYEDSGDEEFPPSIFYDFDGNKDDGFDTPREAFAALIDKVSGKGVWESNPWVFAYEFELID